MTWIQSNVIQTCMLATIIVAIATFCTGYIVSLFSIKKSREVIIMGLVVTGICLILSALIILINFL